MFLLRGMRYMQTPKLCVTQDDVDVLTFLSLALSVPFSIISSKPRRVVSLMTFLILLPCFLNLAGSAFTPRSALKHPISLQWACAPGSSNHFRLCIRTLFIIRGTEVPSF